MAAKLTDAQRRILAALASPLTTNNLSIELYGFGGTLRCTNLEKQLRRLQDAGLVVRNQPPQTDHDRSLGVLPAHYWSLATAADQDEMGVEPTDDEIAASPALSRFYYGES